MENNLEKKEVEQNAKKEWIAPEMQVLNLNGGTNPGFGSEALQYQFS